MIGGCGFCTGLGHCIISSNFTSSPLYFGLEFPQIAFIASMRSRISLKRVPN